MRRTIRFLMSEEIYEAKIKRYIEQHTVSF
jgi:hypothetical protein